MEAVQAAEFETNAHTLGIVEGQEEPTSAEMTVDGITLTVSAAPLTLNDSNKKKTVGISGNKTGQINADEKMILTFDKDVLLKKIELNGVRKKEDGSIETAVVTIQDLDLELTLSNGGIEPETAGVTAKGSARAIFKGKQFLLPAGSEIVLSAGSEGSTFTLRGVEVEEAPDSGGVGASEPE